MILFPKKIKIGGMTYQVTTVTAESEELEDGIAAKIDAVKGTIRVLEGHPVFMQVSLLHEVLHAINMEFPEERIEFLAQALNQIIVDNPQLFESGVTIRERKNK